MMVIFAFVAAYFGLLIVLSVAVRPSRVRLAKLANELLCEDLSLDHRRVINTMLDTAYSMRAAPSHLAAVIIALLTPSATFDRGAEEWTKNNRAMVDDRRWAELFDLHVVSIMAANPIFGAPLGIARLLFRLKSIAFVRRNLRTPAHSVTPKALEMYGELKAAA